MSLYQLSEGRIAMVRRFLAASGMMMVGMTVPLTLYIYIQHTIHSMRIHDTIQ